MKNHGMLTTPLEKLLFYMNMMFFHPKSDVCMSNKKNFFKNSTQNNV